MAAAAAEKAKREAETAPGTSSEGASAAGTPAAGTPAAGASSAGIIAGKVPQTTSAPGNGIAALMKASMKLSTTTTGFPKVPTTPEELAEAFQISETAKYIIFKSLDYTVYRKVKDAIRSARILPKDKQKSEADLIKEHLLQIENLKRFKEVNWN